MVISRLRFCERKRTGKNGGSLLVQERRGGEAGGSMGVHWLLAGGIIAWQSPIPKAARIGKPAEKV